MERKDYLGQEHRKCIRLDTVFPVQFRLVSLDGKHFFSDRLEGFTNNVGKGGICLSVNNLNPELARLLKERQAKLSLGIEMPIFLEPVSALTKVAWIRDVSGGPNKYLIGLSYEEINPLENKRIMRYAWTKKLFIPVTLSIILILALGFGLNSYINVKLIKGNKALVEQLVKIVQESSIAKQKIKGISKKREDLQIKIQALQLRTQTVEDKRKELGEKEKLRETKESERINELNATVWNI